MVALRKLGPGDDLEMLQTPELWPNWPALPVKRYKAGEDWPELGCVLDQTSTPSTIYLVNLFAVSTGQAGDPKSWPKIEYKSFEELLADGWVVD